ncbi:uncharacterized protein [Ptychodera flava]
MFEVLSLVSNGLRKVSLSEMSFRNPDQFIAGELHKYPDAWNELTMDLECWLCGTQLLCNSLGQEDKKQCHICSAKVVSSVPYPSDRGRTQVDLDIIDARMNELLGSKSAYEIQKDKLVQNLESFLSGLPQPKDLTQAMPVDIVRFLIHKDKHARTQVHINTCPFLGSVTRKFDQCECPKRLRLGTLKNIAAKLKSFYGVMLNLGLCKTNPIASTLVDRYIKKSGEEQAKAHITPKQAKPIFTNKIRILLDYILSKLVSSTSRVEAYVYARDITIFKVLMMSGDRAGDLGQIKTQEIVRLPDNSGFIFNHTFGKTLRGEQSNLFAIKRCNDKTLCAVSTIEEYIKLARSFDIDLRFGYLFRPTTPCGQVVHKPISSQAIYQRLKTYLQVLNIDQGETPHSFRSACAIILALAGSQISDLMDHVGWRSEKTANHYMQLHKVGKAEAPASRLIDAIDTRDDITLKYENLENIVTSCRPAFYQ